MRMIHLDDYDVNTMQLAKPIFDSKKRILLGIGSTIHTKYSDILRKLGIQYLFIEDAKSEGITLDEMLDMPVWLDMINIVKEAYEAAANNDMIPLAAVQGSIKLMIQEVKKRNVLILIPTSAVETSLSMYAHAVNVTLLSLQIGRKHRLNEIELMKLGIGCLLHDIGKVRTSEETSHPEVGFNILRANREINLKSAHVAYQHHEQVNGEGFPRKIKEKEILEFAQICGIANDYDNLISGDSMAPHMALEKVMTYSQTRYSHQIVLLFSQVVITYPPGSPVELNIGKGIVTKIENQHRPVVRLDESKKEVDLNKNQTIVIKHAI